jgi:acetoin utilization protein AcuB
MFDARYAGMLMPSIDRYMTTQPWTIVASASLLDALAMMRAHGIRHLPVVDRDKLIGILSDRDVRMHAAIGGDRSAPVREAMSEPVFSVFAGDPIDEVARTMSEHKYGSAIVTTGSGQVAGIFTMVDACRALADLFERVTA